MCLLSYPAMAQDEPDNTPKENTNQQKQNVEPPTNPKGSESDWDLMYDQTVFEKYGSTESPAFLNREKMNPNESDYGYEGGN